MTEPEKLKRCQDCDDNYYNGTGAKKCWCLENAKPCKVFVVGTWQENPQKHMRPIERLQCWRPKRGSGLSVMKREVVEDCECKQVVIKHD